MARRAPTEWKHQRELDDAAKRTAMFLAYYFAIDPESLSLPWRIRLSDSDYQSLKKRALANAHRHPFQYGVLGMSVRVKDRSSVLRNVQTGKSDRRLASGPLASAGELEKHTSEVGDLIGVRIITLSQRHSWNALRSIGYAIENSNQTNPFKLELSSDAGRPWKIFNPPLVKTQYAPYVARVYVDAVADFTDHLAKLQPAVPGESIVDVQVGSEVKSIGAITLSDILGDKGSFANIPFVELMEHLSDQQAEVKLNDRGYSSLQRVLHAKPAGKGSPWHFEIQVRSLLEHAWSEPEHKLSYKGDLSEDTRALLRTLSGVLGSADDSLQSAVDRWREENDDAGSPQTRVFDYRMRVERIDGDRLNHEILRRDIRRIYSLRSMGYYSDAIRICEACRTRSLKAKDWSRYVDFSLELLLSYVYFGVTARIKNKVNLPGPHFLTTSEFQLFRLLHFV